MRYVSKSPLYVLTGSCTAAGFKSCCLGLECYGSESHCSCDQDCYIVGDCCPDIATTCPALVGRNILCYYPTRQYVAYFYRDNPLIYKL